MYLGLYQVVHARRETELSANHKAERIGSPSADAIAQLANWLKDVFRRDHPRQSRSHSCQRGIHRPAQPGISLNIPKG